VVAENDPCSLNPSILNEPLNFLGKINSNGKTYCPFKNESEML